MLIPSIDLLGGRIVQLVQGEKLRLAFDDFEYWIEKFSQVPFSPIDRSRRRHAPGRQLRTRRANCQAASRPGRRRHSLHRTRPPGARRRRKARHHWLRALLSEAGTVNTEFASRLAAAIGAERIVAGIDTKNGRIAVKGWKAQGRSRPTRRFPSSSPMPLHFSTRMSTAKA
jgi:phosphoribosylformimino-5-aminoimidazole carboxamide ribotide isomerase